MASIYQFPQQRILPSLQQSKPIIIAGPCSIETEEQTLQTIQALHQTGKVDVIRAGVWKPRTRPGNFEGIGVAGLPWLQQAKQLTGLPIAIEVATAKQVEQALAHDVDILWIGARTTVNPFSVQEIADALKGVKIPVLIKNPINPDIELWTGAVERIESVGIDQIGLIHRGFSSYGDSNLRNVPLWNIPINMKTRFPDYPMIIDPSHITGNRQLIQEILQKGIDLDYHGAIIESHINPEAAWSDAKQQVTPNTLAEILTNISWKNASALEDVVVDELQHYRDQIDTIDDQLLELIAKRMNISEQIGNIKRKHNITILQAKRWNSIYERLKILAQDKALSTEFIEHYLEVLHLESIKHQEFGK